MKFTKIFLPLAFGLIGGFISIWIVDFLGEKKMDTGVAHELVLPSGHPIVRQVKDVGTEVAVGNVDLREAAQKAVSAVVNVTPIRMGRVYYGNPLDFWFGGGSVREEPIDVGIGSGVIISSDGYIITNNHVVEECDKVMVTLNDRRKFEAKLVGTDPDTDIALLKIETVNLQPIGYGNSDDVSLGEWVLAVGNPYNLTSTVTAGIISAKARGLGGKMSLESFLQTDAAVNPGNSGGALVNAKGELIGINTAIQSPTGSYSGYSFAVPVNIARKVVSDLKEYGKVQRAVLGIRMGELTPELADKMNLKESAGIFIGEVLRGGAADKAGLKANDILLKINGHEVNTVPQLIEQLGQYTPGNTIQLTFSRDGEVRSVDLVLQSSYGGATVATHSEILGAQFASLTREERLRYRLNRGIKIQKLGNGKFKSAGLAVGDIIIKINNTVIRDVEDLRKVIEASGNEGVFVTAVTPEGGVEYFAFSLSN